MKKGQRDTKVATPQKESILGRFLKLIGHRKRQDEIYPCMPKKGETVRIYMDDKDFTPVKKARKDNKIKAFAKKK